MQEYASTHVRFRARKRPSAPAPLKYFSPLTRHACPTPTRPRKAYDEIGIDCPEVFELLCTIAEAAVDHHLSYVPDLQRPAAGRVLHTLAARGSSGGKPAAKRRKTTAQAPRSNALNAYHQAIIIITKPRKARSSV